MVNLADTGRADWVADLVAIGYDCCARLYGPRRAKRKTETIVRALTGGQEAPMAQEPEREQKQEVAEDATR